jgi:hypothetical protein
MNNGSGSGRGDPDPDSDMIETKAQTKLRIETKPKRFDVFQLFLAKAKRYFLIQFLI